MWLQTHKEQMNFPLYDVITDSQRADDLSDL